MLFGYNRVLDTVRGVPSPGPYSGGGYMDEIVLKDKMPFRGRLSSRTPPRRNTAGDHFYRSAQAGVTETKLRWKFISPDQLRVDRSKTSLRPHEINNMGH